MNGLLNFRALKHLSFELKFVLLGSLYHAYFYLGVLGVLCVSFYRERESFIWLARRAALNQIFIICSLMWLKILTCKFDPVVLVFSEGFQRVLVRRYQLVTIICERFVLIYHLALILCHYFIRKTLISITDRQVF